MFNRFTYKCLKCRPSPNNSNEKIFFDTKFNKCISCPNQFSEGCQKKINFLPV